jgi:hypothetical protein
VARTRRPDDPFRRLIHVEQLLWITFTVLLPAVIVGAALFLVDSAGETLLRSDLAMLVAFAASVSIIVVSTQIGRTMMAADRLDAVQYQLLPAIDGAGSDDSVPEPMRQAYRQAAYLHRVALIQFALADTAVMAGLLVALLANDTTPAFIGAAAAILHGLIHRPRLRGFLRERGRADP